MLISARQLTFVVALAALVVAATTAGAIQDLMAALEIVPLEGQAKPFTLPALDGSRIALGDVAGRPALLYFWATW